MLEENNVKLVGIGLEELGVNEFIEAKYLDGGIYIIKEQQTYKIEFFNASTIIISRKITL